jgi:hypothetical protein
MLPAYLIAAASAIILTLGVIHLVYTFRGHKLHPRDEALKLRMQDVSPVISRETTMWKTWIGFNATHSFGAILFGWIYGYLALQHSRFLFDSIFLLVSGLVTLAAYVVIARLYFFSIPYRGIVAATVLYALGLVVHFA